MSAEYMLPTYFLKPMIRFRLGMDNSENMLTADVDEAGVVEVVEACGEGGGAAERGY